MKEEIVEFLKHNCPTAFHAWRRHQNHPTPDTLIGRNVRTIRPGFGGDSGQRLVVKSYDEKRDELTLTGKDRFDGEAEYGSHFNLNIRERGIIDSLVPNLATHRAWYLDFEVIPDTTVLLLAGVPGSGKTTMAKDLENPEGNRIAQFYRISSDDVGRNKWKLELQDAIERKEKYIVLDRCHTTLQARNKVMDILRPYGDKIVTIIATLPDVGYSELEKRVLNDDTHKCTPEKRLIATKSHIKTFEPVSSDEEWHVKWEMSGSSLDIQLRPLWAIIRQLR